MYTTCHKQHERGAHHRSHADGKPRVGYQIEIEHESHAGRHEEKAHVGDQKTAHRGYILNFQQLLLKQKRHEKHAQYAPGDRYTREPYDNLTYGQTAENDETLLYHFLSVYADGTPAQTRPRG